MLDFKGKMHQIRFLLGLRPGPAGGAYSAHPDPLAVFKGVTSKGRDGEGGGERKGREGKGKRKGRERKGGEGVPTIGKSGSASGFSQSQTNLAIGGIAANFRPTNLRFPWGTGAPV